MSFIDRNRRKPGKADEPGNPVPPKLRGAPTASTSQPRPGYPVQLPVTTTSRLQRLLDGVEREGLGPVDQVLLDLGAVPREQLLLGVEEQRSVHVQLHLAVEHAELLVHRDV